jgi:hypothetical protein
MKTKTKKSEQREAYSANTNKTHNQSTQDIKKEFEDDVASAKKNLEKKMQWLKISKQISPEGVLKLTRLKTEDIQDLAEALKTNKTITTLDLSHNTIDDEGARALADALKTNTTISTLDLRDNDIGDQGARTLSDALKTNTTISTLDLSDNDIGDQGARALSDALKINTTISTLDLAANEIGDEGARALADLMKNNTQITKLDTSYAFITKADKKYEGFIYKQCALNAQKPIITNNIAGALDLLTQETSVSDVNQLIAEKLFVLDKSEKLNHIKLIQRPHSVINQYA